MSPTLSGMELRMNGAPPGEWVVLSYRAREGLSSLFQFDVRCVAAQESSAYERLVGQPIEFAYAREGTEPRVVRGVLAHLRATRARDGAGRAVLEFRVAPRMWLLTRRKSSRIFQSKTILEVFEAVLGGVDVRVRALLERRHPTRSYAVQYQETDYDFVSRLAAEEGIFFRCEDGADVVVFADAPQFYGAPTPGDVVRLPFRGAAGLESPEEAVHRFEGRRRVEVESVSIRDYDFQHPTRDLGARAVARSDDRSRSIGAQHAAPTGLEFYEHGRDHDDAETPRAHIRLDQLRSRAHVGRGETSSRRVVPAARVELEGHPDVEHNREHVVVRTTHRGRASGASASDAASADRPAFECRFECVPSDVLYRPGPRERRLNQVLESAIVVGPPGEEIHTDAFGRIKVQFHWDREGRNDDRSSCWLRVLQPWAGSGWGVQFIPRVGMEVLVSFLGGDIDRPVVVGAVSNLTTPTPFALPEQRTRSGIRTRTSPDDGGFNELSFEDAAGREVVHLRAQRDHVERVGQDSRTSVARQREIEVGGDETRAVRGHRRAVVGGDDEVRVTGAREVVVAGASRHAVRGDASIEIDGAHGETIGAGSSRRIAGGASTVIGGTRELRVDGASRTHVEGDVTTYVGGTHRVSVGRDDDARAGEASLEAKRSYEVRAGETITIGAGQSLTLAVGEVQVRLDTEGIRLSIDDTVVALSKDRLYAFAKELRLLAGDELSAKRGDTFVKLTSDATEVASKTIHLHADGASLELDTRAKLEGDQVRLNSDHGRRSSVPGEDSPPTNEDEPHSLHLVLRDPDGRPYARRPYVLVVDGKEHARGTTGGDGSIDEPISPRATSAHITLDAADDHEIEIPLRLGRLPPADSIAGIKTRLRNLGRYGGPIDGELDRPTRDALRRFQHAEGLEETGRMDDATRARVLELSGEA